MRECVLMGVLNECSQRLIVRACMRNIYKDIDRSFGAKLVCLDVCVLVQGGGGFGPERFGVVLIVCLLRYIEKYGSMCKLCLDIRANVLGDLCA